jgi:hypothetical protein
MALFLVVTLYIVFKEKSRRQEFWILVILSLASVFIKETYFVVAANLLFLFLIWLLPMTRVRLGWKKIQKKLLVTGLSLLAFQILVFLIRKSYGGGQNYSSNYDVSNLQLLFSGFKSYLSSILFYQFPIFHISLAYFFYFLITAVVRRKELKLGEWFYIFLWTVVFVQLAVLAPWRFVLGRYVLVVNLGLCLVYAVTFQRIYNVSFPKIFKLINTLVPIPQLELLFAAALLPVFVVRNIFPVANYQLWEKTDSIMSYETVRAVADHVHERETLIANFKNNDTNIEVFYEVGWHLEEFYGRKSTKLTFLDDSNLCAKEQRFILDRTSDRFLRKETFEESNIFQHIDSGGAAYEPINYGVILRSFIYGQKLEGWSSQYNFDWAIYKQKANTCIR